MSVYKIEHKKGLKIHMLKIKNYVKVKSIEEA